MGEVQNPNRGNLVNCRAYAGDVAAENERIDIRQWLDWSLDRMSEEQARRPGYPAATYHGTNVAVLVGDHVQFRLGLFFWRGWQAGRVRYVPGISPMNDELEFNGLTWVAIHDARGEQSGHVVLPGTGQLRRNVRFVRRADDGLTQTPAGYHFGGEHAPKRLP